ncbi:hypothetical protein MPTK1_7g13280 [Marchantia polymorpha subsp. ruderalis]|uniref:Uncharacterized protein n=2 Tax=Marchantia polymorpha TaxID=3197 RepID=A0AAF6BZ43_MARPO|nr:hypothetical protein MARPO_0009s0014 [Marchantia polymorpha]BBN17277.1 hypothetical protein Mp_7g13280 [Marchantia polymorpha subsp. ruderalis]|eukprot:PTQ46882.1 hypothetical protein MARPO_0009s0014 [Marchantia polymorpha]
MPKVHAQPPGLLQARKTTVAHVAAAAAAVAGVGGKRYKAGGNAVHDEVVNVQVPTTGVWTVVSNLLQALGEARDDLLSLMSSDSFRGLRSSTVEPSSKPWKPRYKDKDSHRSSSPAAPRSNSHPVESSRNHYTTKASAADPNQNQRETVAGGAIEYCAPVAFGMNLDFERVHRGRSSPAAGSTLEYNHHQLLPRESDYEPPLPSRPTTATPRSAASAALKALSKASISDCVGPYPEGKRVCKAARYADLLRAEANQLRERRLAEEPISRLSKPSWL